MCLGIACSTLLPKTLLLLLLMHLQKQIKRFRSVERKIQQQMLLQKLSKMWSRRLLLLLLHLLILLLLPQNPFLFLSLLSPLRLNQFLLCLLIFQIHLSPPLKVLLTSLQSPLLNVLVLLLFYPLPLPTKISYQSSQPPLFSEIGTISYVANSSFVKTPLKNPFLPLLSVETLQAPGDQNFSS